MTDYHNLDDMFPEDKGFDQLNIWESQVDPLFETAGTLPFADAIYTYTLEGYFRGEFFSTEFVEFGNQTQSAGYFNSQLISKNLKDQIDSYLNRLG